MRILVADDDSVFRRLYCHLLESQGHETVQAENGEQAWQALHRVDAPRFAILDWVMPGIEGVELCRRLRATARHRLSYLIVSTSKSETVDLVSALDAGANDFLAKPFAPGEFNARIAVGVRTLALQDRLIERLVALEAAALDGFRGSPVLPVCMYCKSVRDRSDRWHERESFLEGRAGVPFSHGICPVCETAIVQPMLEKTVLDRKDPRPEPEDS